MVTLRYKHHKASTNTTLRLVRCFSFNDLLHTNRIRINYVLNDNYF
jgi:hypothetical protein